jgi:hypothetical protein
MSSTSDHPHGSSDPTPAEIAQRCEEIRRQWSPCVERLRQAQPVGPIVYRSMPDADWLPTSEWDVRVG